MARILHVGTTENSITPKAQLLYNSGFTTSTNQTRANRDS